MTALLEVTDLSVTFDTGDVRVPAVRGATYHIDPGEVLAIVGESGSGKSTAAMAVVGLLPEYGQVSGSVRLQGRELLELPDQAMSQVRGKTIGTVFQDPMSALTPSTRSGTKSRKPSRSTTATSAGQPPARAPWSCSSSSASHSRTAGRKRFRTSCPAASGSGWSSRLRSPTIRIC